MIFMVEMTVNPPSHIEQDEFSKLVASEKARAEELQKSGTWRHLWRVAGEYSNVSIFDVADAAELHEIMLSLPLFPFMTTSVTALCRHPSSIHEDDR